MSAPKKIHRLRELFAGVGVFAVWGVVAIAHMQIPREPQDMPPASVSPVELSRSFQFAADKLQGRTVEFVQFSDDPDAEPSGVAATIGSGVLIDPTGVVLTTREVAELAGNCRLRLGTGDLLEIGDVKMEPESQLATVKVTLANELQAAPIGDSRSLKTGDWVVAVNSGGADRIHVKPGTIQAVKSGTADDGTLTLLTDAAINPGLEGSPIIDLSGAVVGLVCRRLNGTSRDRSVGTAVSVPKEHPWLAMQLTSTPSRSERHLGFRVRHVTDDVVSRCNLGSAAGAQITRVIPNTPGTEAGLQVGDVVVALGEHRITSPDELQSILFKMPGGLRKPIEIVRDGWRITAHLSLPVAGLD